MKKHTLLIIPLYCLTLNMQAQFCDSASGLCYQDDPCFSSSQIHKQDYKFATVHNIYKSSTASVDLYMTVFSPCNLPVKIDSAIKSLTCKQCKRPFIMLIHAGGFRNGCRTNFSDECMEFARRGYVAATIDYRLGWVEGDEKQNCNNNFCFIAECPFTQDDSCKAIYKDSMNFARYRALQDALAAMRFIAHYANNLNIDKKYLYIGGHSAGSITAVNLCFMSQKELDIITPDTKSILGAINRSGNSFKDSFKIAGLYDNWGSVNDTAYIKGNKNKIPTIAFHGIDDTIVPFAKGFTIGCTNGVYGYSYGSSLICKRLVNNYPGIPVELYCCYGGHGIFNDASASKDLKALYRVQKAVCFFNRVRNGDKTQTYIRINKQDHDISYQELDSISPVNCSYTDSINHAIRLSFGNDYLVKNNFSVYPNPATTTATLVFNATGKSIIKLTDISGKILQTKTVIAVKGENTLQLDVSRYAAGVYFITIINEKNETQTLRLNKE